MELFLQQLVNGLAWGSIYVLLALGYTMVYGVLKLINFAHGEVFMAGAMTAFYVHASRPELMAAWSPFTVMAVLFLASALVCALLALLIERIAYRPLRSAPRLSALITAIGVSLLLQNAGQMVFGANPKVFPTMIESRPLLTMGTVVVSNLQAIVILTGLILVAALELFIHRTRLGRAIRATSFNPKAASLMGIDVDRVIAATFVIGAVMAAAASILYGMFLPKIDPLMGLMPGLKSFVAAVLGGIGSLPGAALGGLIMGLAETFVTGYISSNLRDAIAFVLLIFILIYRPGGILGNEQPEKV
ncbi:MAG: branched-chain amino acid ABC transporter permease [Deltaproteobacteria bacterium]|nr:branched-chain amino acid ABC transporter permease [Deltaproteobacteria bacterium]